VISSVNLADCHRRKRQCSSIVANLAPAFGAPGPHDFARPPRVQLVSQPLASTATRLAPHDDRDAPHRNNDGNLAMLKLMLARPSVAHEMILDRHVDYVVICQTRPNRSIIERAPDGLEATLARGEAPDFLEPIDVASAGKITTWRVRK
jgi:hypothetical protein